MKALRISWLTLCLISSFAGCSSQDDASGSGMLSGGDGGTVDGQAPQDGTSNDGAPGTADNDAAPNDSGTLNADDASDGQAPTDAGDGLDAGEDASDGQAPTDAGDGLDAGEDASDGQPPGDGASNQDAAAGDSGSGDSGNDGSAPGGGLLTPSNLPADTCDSAGLTDLVVNANTKVTLDGPCDSYVPQGDGLPTICVHKFANVSIGQSATLLITPSSSAYGAVAIVATGNFQVAGEIYANDGAGDTRGTGLDGNLGSEGGPGPGGGGAGHVNAGAHGGTFISPPPADQGGGGGPVYGPTSGTQLVPGSRGGNGWGYTAGGVGTGGEGGGALQIVACGELDLSGAIYASGWGGSKGHDGNWGGAPAGGGGGGGGSGGTLVIDANRIVGSATATVAAIGGTGGQGGDVYKDGVGVGSGAPGGRGASGTNAPMTGGCYLVDPGGNVLVGCGGGGGGLGRIVINQPQGAAPPVLQSDPPADFGVAGTDGGGLDGGGLDGGAPDGQAPGGGRLTPSNVPADICDTPGTADLNVSDVNEIYFDTSVPCDVTVNQGAGLPSICVRKFANVNIAGGLSIDTSRAPYDAVAIVATGTFTVTGGVGTTGAGDARGTGTTITDGNVGGAGGSGAGHITGGGAVWNPNTATKQTSGGNSYPTTGTQLAAGAVGGHGAIISSGTGGLAGGALQLIACGDMTLAGRVSANGGTGQDGLSGSADRYVTAAGGGGGGSAGTLLIEALHLVGSGNLTSVGGAGGKGGDCGTGNTILVSGPSGGVGGTGSQLPGDGQPPRSITLPGPPFGCQTGASGGGGAMGRIVVNLPPGAPAPALVTDPPAIIGTVATH